MTDVEKQAIEAALLFISTSFSNADNPVGGAFISVRVDIFFVCNGVPSSTKAYFPVL